MAIVGIGTGTYTLGRRQVDKDGNLVKETKASWGPDSSGGSVAIWPIDPETNEASGPASIFGDWAIMKAMTGPGSKGNRTSQQEIDNILRSVGAAGVPVFMKDSLAPIVGEESMRREFPWDR